MISLSFSTSFCHWLATEHSIDDRVHVMLYHRRLCQLCRPAHDVLQPIECHVHALIHPHFDQPVSVLDRSIDDMHTEFRRIFRELFKFQELKLDAKSGILPFTRPDDFSIRKKPPMTMINPGI
jgi:hypothetical protein